MTVATRLSPWTYAWLLGAAFLAACAAEPTETLPPTSNEGEPFRIWSFGTYPGDRGSEIRGPFQTSGIPVVDAHDFGPLHFVVDGNGHATGEVISRLLGQSYVVSTQGPSGLVGDPSTAIGSTVELQQIMDYRKVTPDASFILHVNAIELEAIDQSNDETADCEVGPPGGGFVCFPSLTATVSLNVMVYGDTGIFFMGQARVDLISRFGKWSFGSTVPAPGTARLWGIDEFFVNFDPGLTPVGSIPRATLRLSTPLAIPVDISEVDTGGLFTVRIFARAETYDLTQRETYLAAGFKRPTNAVFTEVETEGLEARATDPNRPVPPVGDFGTAPACPAGGNPDAGLLQFSAPAFRVPELPIGGPEQITVTRTGGSSGVVSALVTSTDGSALAGTDYSAVTTTVSFGDNDAAPRTVSVPVLPNSTPSPNKTVNVRLSDPRGCATLGASTATLTIVDDDQPVVPTGFSIGGTVTGLAGSGLSLRNLPTGETLPVANGSFAFNQLSPDRLTYDVTVLTQPTNPAQVCTITNGSGTVSGADITNIGVDCITPTSGGMDPSFSGDGKVETLVSGASGGAVALQTDGKIVVAGSTDLGASVDFALLRYDASGTLDPSFGAGGIVTTGFGTNSTDEGLDLAVQADGKVVVVGRTAAVAFDFDFAVARYKTDGSLDSTFGSNGKLVTDFGPGQAIARAVALLPDGRILVVGDVGSDFALARYLTNGSPDPTFGTDGKATVDVTGGDIGHGVALLGDGRFIVVGGAATGIEKDFGVVRFAENGAIDSTFGTNGLATTNLGGVDEAFDVVIEPNGRIVAAGSIDGPGGAQGVDFALARYNSDGSPDLTFGSGGKTTTNFTAGRDRGAALVRQADGKLVVAGLTTSGSFAFNNFALARYLTDGRLDTSFGVGGTLAIDINGGHSAAAGLAIQADGKIVAAGTGGAGFAVVRLLP